MGTDVEGPTGPLTSAPASLAVTPIRSPPAVRPPHDGAPGSPRTLGQELAGSARKVQGLVEERLDPMPPRLGDFRVVKRDAEKLELPRRNEATPAPPRG